MKDTTFIYALCEPGTRTIRYIGKANDPQKRLGWHLKDSRKLKSHLGHWLSKLFRENRSPKLLLLKKVPLSEWQEWEKRYIFYARMLGFNLTNASDGGDGVTMTPEVRIKLSLSRSGKLASFETKKKLSLARSGNRNHNFGKPLTAETKAKISATKIGRKLTPEHIANVSAALKGIPRPNRSKSHCLAISLGHKGKKRSPEHCEKISKGMLGRIRGPYKKRFR